MKRQLFFLLSIALSCFSAEAKDYKLNSPDGRTNVTVSVGADIRWQVSRDGQTVILPSEMAVVLGDGTVLGNAPRVRSAKATSVDRTFRTPVYHKSEIRDRYNQLVLKMSGDYSVEFRAYDSGVAYRFATSRKGDMVVKDSIVAIISSPEIEAKKIQAQGALGAARAQASKARNGARSEDITALKAMADRVIVVKNGKAVQEIINLHPEAIENIEW